MKNTVAFVGSRGLPPTFYPLIKKIIASVINSDRVISVGCCTGLDAFVLSAAPVNKIYCFSAFGPEGEGSFIFSAVDQVKNFYNQGGIVKYWAGGKGQLKHRLANRTKTVISSASVSTVVFFGSPNSKGSALACRLSISRGLRVYAFACGFPGEQLPALKNGKWKRVGGSGIWSSSWCWEESQAVIF
mgnify:CR=1 FL=1